MFLRLLALTLLSASTSVLAAPSVQVASPDGSLSVAVTTDNDGRPSYAVSRKGNPVIAASRLGFIFVDAPKFERNFVIAAHETKSFDETWELPWGERRSIRNHYNEMRVTLTEKNALKRSLDVVFRVYDDGLGFRYEFPLQDALKQVKSGLQS